jgi:hypothetical protein
VFRSHRPLRWLVASALMLIVLAPIAAYAAGTFVDDDTSIFEADIEWMAGNEITLGCNPPANDRYCPDDNVTRGQMAAFMHRLADSYAVNAGNALRLNDRGPGYYENMIWASGVVDVNKTLILEGVDMTTLSITTAWDGYLLINATVSVLDGSDTSQTHWWLQVDIPVCNPIPANSHQVDQVYATISGDATRQSAALTGAVPVSAGSHTITLCGNATTALMTKAYDPSVTALFSPLGEVPTP